MVPAWRDTVAAVPLYSDRRLLTLWVTAPTLESAMAVARSSIHAGTAWTEWELAGMRADGAAFLMCGVVIYEVRDDLLASARVFLEPVDPTGSDVNEAVRSVLGTVDLESPENTS